MHSLNIIYMSTAVTKYVCPTPSVPTNGYIEGDNYDIGHNITYHCDAGYRLVGGPARADCEALLSSFLIFLQINM
jgi:hypothetical protein